MHELNLYTLTHMLELHPLCEIIRRWKLWGGFEFNEIMVGIPREGD